MYAPEPPEPSRPQADAWQPGGRTSPVPPPPAASPSLPRYASDGVANPWAQARAQQLPGRWLRVPAVKPLVTPVLLGILVLIYLPMVLSDQINTAVLNWGENQHMLVMQGEWYRLVTSTFLHASIGGIPFIHLLSNAYGLWAIGMELERLIGRWRFAFIYGIAAVAGSVASFAFTPANVSSVGASGAIFGLIGAMAVYFALHRKLFGRLGNAWFWNMIIIIILNSGIGFSGILPVDNSAHIGGLVAGAVAGFVLSPRYALGDWYNIFVRNVVNVNAGRLPWIAAGLMAMIVVFIFIDLFLMFQAGILQPTYLLGSG